MFLHSVTLRSVCSFAWLQFVPRVLNEFYRVSTSDWSSLVILFLICVLDSSR